MLILITSGQGPEECQLAVSLLLTALAEETAAAVLGEQKGRFANCLRSVLVHVPDMSDVPEGTVQWICKSPFRPKVKRQNWFIGVRILPEPETSLYDAANGDIIVQTFGSGGKGGQHANKTESGVRVIHLPTGLTAVSADERSQFVNKKTALERLNSKLALMKERGEAETEEDIFLTHKRLERGNAVRVYKGTSFIRVK